MEHLSEPIDAALSRDPGITSGDSHKGQTVARKELISRHECGNGQATPPVEIGWGGHGVVELDPESMLICKRFLNENRSLAAEEARREFDYLNRFAKALSTESYLACPEPVSVGPEQGRLWMTQCAGERMDDLLKSEDRRIEQSLEHIAEQLYRGVGRFVSEFGEPLHDLAMKHILYDSDTGVVSLIDFAYPAFLEDYGPDQSPWEVTIGTFIGNSTYDTVRPVHCRNASYASRQQQLAAELLKRMKAHRSLNLRQARDVSSIVYRELGPRGKPPRAIRQLWFHTAGQILFRRRRGVIFNAC